MKAVYSFFHRLLDFMSPSSCCCCGCRLSQQEHYLCISCQRHLPFTNHVADPYENELAKLFWHRVPIERAAALYYHLPHAESAKIIYAIKYGNHPEVGEHMGRLMAEVFADEHFFDGITAVVPVPLSLKREHSRGYNQSNLLARGIGDSTHIPVYNKVLKRTSFNKSQTQLRQSERHDNVEGVFEAAKDVDLSGEHILLVDDVVTTGATLSACIHALMQNKAQKFSIASLCYSKN